MSGGEDVELASRILSLVREEDFKYIVVYEDGQAVFWSGLPEWGEELDLVRKMMEKLRGTRVLLELQSGDLIVGEKSENRELYVVASRGTAFVVFEIVRRILQNR